MRIDNMTQYRLEFPPWLNVMETHGAWQEAIDLLYENWKKAPNNLNNTICLGGEIWYVLYLHSISKSDPAKSFPAINEDLLLARLVEVTRFGIAYFSNNAVFCSYFGYMIKVIPYFFYTDTEPYILTKDCFARQEAAINLMREAYAIEPGNPFAKVMYYETDNSAEYYLACDELWKQTPVAQWGDSEVSQYFMRIMNGDAKSDETTG